MLFDSRLLRVLPRRQNERPLAAGAQHRPRLERRDLGAHLRERRAHVEVARLGLEDAPRCVGQRAPVAQQRLALRLQRRRASCCMRAGQLRRRVQREGGGVQLETTPVVAGGGAARGRGRRRRRRRRGRGGGGGGAAPSIDGSIAGWAGGDDENSGAVSVAALAMFRRCGANCFARAARGPGWCMMPDAFKEVPTRKLKFRVG